MECNLDQFGFFIGNLWKYLKFMVKIIVRIKVKLLIYKLLYDKNKIECIVPAKKINKYE